MAHKRRIGLIDLGMLAAAAAVTATPYLAATAGSPAVAAVVASPRVERAAWSAASVEVETVEAANSEGVDGGRLLEVAAAAVAAELPPPAPREPIRRLEAVLVSATPSTPLPEIQRFVPRPDPEPEPESASPPPPRSRPIAWAAPPPRLRADALEPEPVEEPAVEPVAALVELAEAPETVAAEAFDSLEPLSLEIAAPEAPEAAPLEPPMAMVGEPLPPPLSLTELEARIVDEPPVEVPLEAPTEAPPPAAALEGEPLTDLELARMIYGGDADAIGRRPERAPLSAPVVDPAPLADAPKIALVIGALGLNDAVTRQALDDLPSEVTLAFAPARAAVSRHARRAAREGRVFLTEIPMEPMNYPQIDPGPLTLLAADPPAENRERLRTALARAPGAVGISTYLGARYAADPAAANALAEALSERGLFLFENQPAARSRLRDAAAGAGLPYLRGAFVIDADRDPASIRDALARLEERALENGGAIGVGAAYGETIGAVRLWAAGLQDRGVRLVTIDSFSQ